MSEKGIKGMLELIVPRLLRMIMEKQLLTEKEALSSVRARGNEALAFKYSYLI